MSKLDIIMVGLGEQLIAIKSNAKISYTMNAETGVIHIFVKNENYANGCTIETFKTILEYLQKMKVYVYGISAKDNKLRLHAFMGE
jgi:hypothetical protein